MTSELGLPRELTGRRVLLRPPRLADVDDLMTYVNDPDWARYLPVPQPYLREHAVAWIESMLVADWVSRPLWAIEVEGRLQGMTNAIMAADLSEAELGISLDPGCWGRGYAREVLEVLGDALFAKLAGLVRLRAWTDCRNLRARRLLEGLGYHFEGIVADRRVVRGESIDDAGYVLARP
ncbi:MAG: GNAT family N-acetyltransferase [Planctomycetes bacterium]|nr:GNAT family N-acetyltransferase [Planctomycetota bacterium]